MGEIADDDTRSWRRQIRIRWYQEREREIGESAYKNWGRRKESRLEIRIRVYCSLTQSESRIRLDSGQLDHL